MFLPQLVSDHLSSLCISYGRTIAYRNVESQLEYARINPNTCAKL
jgi:hypothetical protein